MCWRRQFDTMLCSCRALNKPTWLWCYMEPARLQLSTLTLYFSLMFRIWPRYFSLFNRNWIIFFPSRFFFNCVFHYLKYTGNIGAVVVAAAASVEVVVNAGRHSHALFFSSCLKSCNFLIVVENTFWPLIKINQNVDTFNLHSIHALYQEREEKITDWLQFLFWFSHTVVGKFEPVYFFPQFFIFLKKCFTFKNVLLLFPSCCLK